jgi:peptidoglycan/LPS O-acetylase OafA/YrhL
MGHVKEFDGLRGLLALWVFIAHAIELGPYSSVARHLHPEYAVDVFIILSGFVIFHLLSRGEDFATFITRRFFRLFPVFAVCFLFALLLMQGWKLTDGVAFGYIAPHSLRGHMIAHATMLHGALPEQLLPNSAAAVLPPAWSISLEWQFYLIAPLLFWFVLRPGWKFGAALAALIIVRVLVMSHSAGLLLPGAPRDLAFNSSAFLPMKIEFFAAGALSWMLWRAYREGRVKLTSRRLTLAMAGALVIMVATKSPPLGFWMAGFALLLDANGEVMCRFSKWVTRVLTQRMARFLGEISYSFYLVHLPTIVLMRQVLAVPMSHRSPMTFALTVAVSSASASLVFAWLLHVLVEKPMMAFGKRLTLRWSTPPALVDASPQRITTGSSSQ